MKTKVIALLLVLVLVMAAGFVMAQARQGRQNAPAAIGAQEMGAQWMNLGPRIAKALNLSQDQIHKLKQIREEFRSATEQSRTELKSKRQELIKLWAADEPSAAAIKSLQEDMDAPRKQIRDAAIDGGVAALKVLTPDQRAKLRQMIKNRIGARMGMGPAGRLRQRMGAAK